MRSATESISTEDLENQLDEIIKEAGLRRPENEFFRDAHSVDDVSPPAALRLARQWQLVTKAFMLTTIAGLGAMAREMHCQENPDRVVLSAFQTAYRVIGDDLCNLAPVFSAVSPEGAAGIHYLWWADSITSPLTKVQTNTADQEGELPAGISGLIDYMTKLADDRLGAAVQLRVVESIALDIAVAFRRVYSKTLANGEKVFPTAESLAWIDSHIKAETSHAASVSDDDTGMTAMVADEADRGRLSALVEEYSAHWSRTLLDFRKTLKS